MAELLGHSVLAWAQLERVVEVLASCLLNFHGLKMEEAKLVTYNLGLRENGRVVIALASRAKLPHKRLNRISELINSCQNELSLTRNRIYHDRWEIDDGGLHKMSKVGTRLTRPQAFKLDLLVPDYEPFTSVEVQAFIDKCLNTADALLDEGDFVAERQGLTPRKGSDAKSPRRKTLWSRLLGLGS